VEFSIEHFHFMMQTVPPFPQLDIIGAMVIVWRARGKIILCSIVCNNCTQWTAHTYEQN